MKKSTKKPEPDITLFFHCKKCIASVPKGVAPREWAQLEAGWTPAGFQVWCKRHEENVVNIDFLGQKVGYAKED